MTPCTRFEVLPDRDGGWSVTRDAVVLGVWPSRGKAIRYAADRAGAVTRGGGQVVVAIRRADGRMHGLRRLGPERQ